MQNDLFQNVVERTLESPMHRSKFELFQTLLTTFLPIIIYFLLFYVGTKECMFFRISRMADGPFKKVSVLLDTPKFSNNYRNFFVSETIECCIFSRVHKMLDDLSQNVVDRSLESQMHRSKFELFQILFNFFFFCVMPHSLKICK